MEMKKITVPDILKMKEEGRKIPVLTAYGFQMARILDSAGIPVLLVGDSAGMVEAGYENTLPITMDEMIYHTRSVARGRTSALVVADMPFGSYQVSISEARKNAARLVKEGRAEAVKAEGGVRAADVVRAITDMDIPVMGHIGLTPQSIHRMGGYRVQGKGKDASERLMDDAQAVQDAGAFAVVLEGIPAALAKEITASLSIPTIGIGAGVECDGQVLVVDDMLGLNTDSRLPKYVKKYADLKGAIEAAAGEYIKDVTEGRFPAKEQSY
ncbi:MAG: 3-methyl-2-oxobutanoate hydroxymethyltransferase [Deltaproteobacteria bacterium]|nr:3-methyl-2-oxobutanoate hydroxymethyltransferase [Deltaproteobacteria bacterium]